MDSLQLWDRFKKNYLSIDSLGIALDTSRMKFGPDFLPSMDARARKALADMAALEKGAIANPDEKRMVGHYWLRNSALAPNAELKQAIDSTLASMKKFTKALHAGKLKPQKAKRFTKVLVVGIGGSALGPQFVAKALGAAATDKLTPYFFDNTDPNGIDAVLAQIGAGLKETLTIVISKSGGTKETRNGMLEARRAYEAAKLNFSKHVVAVTQEGSELDKVAVGDGWLARFPMWDWVGGRTSELSAVGLLPAALQGLDIQGMLNGARDMDTATREQEPAKNAAVQLALMWYHAGEGRGKKDMVILPYKDRLELFSKYLQQLVMESIGKEKDLNGNVVNQGIAVYGNKGSTDQHAYVQQLREGVNNFFATFIEVLQDRGGKSMQVEPNVTSGDYLNGFYQGTRKALYENNRESITITVPDASARTVGALIALYERAVGLYASIVNINAYHQPGVEAGKKAATAVIALQLKVIGHLKANKGQTFTAEQVAGKIGAAGEVETVFKILQHVAANKDHGIKRKAGATVFEAGYSA